MRKGALNRKLTAAIEKPPKDHIQVWGPDGKPRVKKRVQKLLSKPKKRLDPAKNPLRGFIGIADVEPFAPKIDEELYGKRV